LSTRSVVLFGAMLIALALIVLALIGASAKQADAATNIVTKTFSNSGLILIPDGAVPGNDTTCATGVTFGAAAPYPSQKTASFPSGSHIRDVNLTLKNYSHSFPNDVDVLLKKGTHNRTVMSDVGGGRPGVSNITLVLDDEATNGHLTSTNAPTGGRFKPTNVGTGDGFPAPAPIQDNRSALSGFDTLNPSGTWSLFVQDDSGGDCGKFGGGWSIKIKAAVPG
jgi:hypothetical protein